MKILIKTAIGCIFAAMVWSCGIYTNFNKPEYGFENKAFGQMDSVMTESAKIVSWREFFTDPQLAAIIDSALAHNSNMQIAQLKAEEAKAALTASKLAFFPSLSFTAQGTYSSSEWTVNLPAQASWQLDIFGSLRNAKKQKEAALRQSEAYVQAVRANIISTVASTYYSLLALDSEYELYRQTKESWKTNVEVTRRLMDAGQYTQAALSQTEANYYSICNSVISIEDEISATENNLCSLLGITPQHIERGNFSQWTAPAIANIGVPTNVLSLRTDVRQAEESLASAFYVTNETRSAFYPSITITGSMDFYKDISSALGSLTQPLFQRGKLTANYKTAVARQQEAESTFRQTLIDAGIEVNNAYRQISVAHNKAANCDLQVASLQKSLESTQQLMTHLSTTYLEVLTAQQSLLSAEIGQITNRLNEISATITLYQAIGGGVE